MHDVGRFVTQRLVRTLAVVPQGDFLRGVEGKVFGQADQQLAHRGIALQVHIMMRYASPEPLDEDVVECSPSAIHADDHASTFQYIGESRADELRALVTVEYFRRAVMA